MNKKSAQKKIGKRKFADNASRQPANANRQPANANRQPANANRQPANANRQPASANRQPANANRQPASANRQPASANRQPADNSKQKRPVKPKLFAKRKAKKPDNNYKQSEFVKSKGNLPGNTERRKFRKAPKKTAAERGAMFNKKADKELARVMNEKTPAKKKRSFRGRNYVLYYILFAIVIVTVLIILSNTVLFRCTQIEVSGNIRYTPEQIITGSELGVGDNLLHIDADKAAKNIVDKCLFIDEAEVRKSFPTKLVITVKEADICFCICENGKNAAVSRGGRIIKYLDDTSGILTLKGFEPESLELGAWVKSKNETKNDLPWEMIDILEAAKLTDVTEIDISDRYSPKVTVDNRIILNLGSASELESKFLVAKALIETEIGENESVIISLSNPEKPAVRPNNSALPNIGNNAVSPETN